MNISKDKNSTELDKVMSNMINDSSQKRILVTGTAGFIGFHLARLLLEKGHIVMGYDGMTSYYDVNLKAKRHELLCEYEKFSSQVAMLEDVDVVEKVFRDFEPEVVIHLAAQAGVRYSLENPRAYIDSNIIGTFNIMDAAKRYNVGHLLMASTSSVYGANDLMPFDEGQKADTQLTIYAATKKATESMGHAYSHLHNIPITMFRFFTVYGPWGRPDMALFKFTKGIVDGVPIDIYNYGDMYRDFTYVDDLVMGIYSLIGALPGEGNAEVSSDSLSPVAPYRVVNIGYSEKVKLLDFIDAIEKKLGLRAKRNFMEMQSGDVPATWADATLLQELTNFKPITNFEVGVGKFVEWYLEYYHQG